MVDHVHIMVSIPPKYSVASVVGFLKGKSAIWIARNFGGVRRGSSGHGRPYGGPEPPSRPDEAASGS